MKTEALLILTPGFPGSDSDTTCLPMQQDLVSALGEMIPQLEIIVLSFQYPYHSRPYSWKNISVIPFNGKNKGGWQRLWLRQKIYKTIRHIHQTRKVIGLLSFWYGECAVVGHHMKKNLGLTHYCWLLGKDARKENKYPAQYLLPASSLIALSDFLQAEFEKNHQVRPFTVIPPGIRIPELSGTTEKDIDLLAVGSLIPLKNFDQLVPLVKELSSAVPGLKAVIIGEGPEKERLQKQLHNAGLDQQIILAGEQPHEEVLRYMSRSKILVHPSSYEGFSGVCQEALAMACHVFSYCKPMKEGYDQWHVVHDFTELKKRVKETLLNPNTEYKQVNLQTAEQTASKILSQFRDEVL